MEQIDDVAESEYREAWQGSTEIRRFIPFNLDEVTWTKVKVSSDGHEFEGVPETLHGKVDFEAYHDFGMWTAYIDAGGFNLLGVKMVPNFTIPRHHHNVHQLVLVHEGEVWQGKRRFVPGDAYFTRAGHPYSITAGPEGCTVFEIRAEPLADLQLFWDEDDPAKWVHGRRPGGPADPSTIDDSPAES
jgi:hypothetical protein